MKKAILILSLTCILATAKAQNHFVTANITSTKGFFGTVPKRFIFLVAISDVDSGIVAYEDTSGEWHIKNAKKAIQILLKQALGYSDTLKNKKRK